ncbi:MAG: prepilin-type N-terminal cleavage/methylation domain-containing protein [Phycisphaerae bacterium]|nr:prepilin-type N-terminal cleavage/methylation domain-containing protein [Phycisphaerae bacterium]
MNVSATPTRRAFTLIELLVVVAIIALLISILLPSLSRARAMARRTYCMGNMREIGKALNFYAEDQNGFFPVVHGTDYADPQPAVQEWWQFLAPYKFRREYMLCPADPHRDDVIEHDPNEDPHAHDVPERIQSYIINGMFVFGKKMDAVIRPADKICLSERGDEGEALHHQGYPAWKAQEVWTDLIKKERHLDRSNYLFVDFHVENLEWEDTIGTGKDEEDRHYLPEFNPPTTETGERPGE